MCDCEISKNCLDYDEFHHLKLVEPSRTDAEHAAAEAVRNTATQKVDMLKEVVQGTKVDEGDNRVREQWRGLARNWLCQGFNSGRYSWRHTRGVLCVTKDDRQIDLRSEVDDITRCIEIGYFKDTKGKEGNRYEKIEEKENPAWGGPADWRRAVRMAMSGSKVDEIMADLSWNKQTTYEFFLAVATQTSGPRLRHVWTHLGPE